MTKAHNLEGLKARAARARAIRDQIAGIHKTHTEQRKLIETELKLKLGELTPVERNQAAPALTSQAKRKIEALAKSTAETRKALTLEMAELKRDMVALKDLISSPRVLATLHAVGTEERARYRAEVDSAGPAQLISLAQLAMLTGNKVLGAAVVDKIGNMPRDFRPKAPGYGADDIAKAIFGAEADEATATISAITRDSDTLAALSGDVDGVVPSGTARIALGLTHGTDNGRVTPPNDSQFQTPQFAKQSRGAPGAFNTDEGRSQGRLLSVDHKN